MTIAGLRASLELKARVKRGSVSSLLFVLTLGVAFVGAAQAQVVEEDPGTSVETCIGCHSSGDAVPVGNIADSNDAHYIDQDPRGPASESGYRQVNVTPTAVDVTGSQVILDFTAADENGDAIDNLFDSDGRFNLTKLVNGALPGDPTQWQQLIPGRRYERFTEAGGVFESFGGGAYRYTSVWDPTTIPVAAGDTLRLAIQISAGDIPPANAWCDFDASLTAANNCTSPVSITRDIVQTDTCNGCHGVTSDVFLREHGSRTKVEYCVTCHNPAIGDTDMTVLIHKIHYGAELTNGDDYLGGKFADVVFTKDIDNCTTCHAQGGADQSNWRTEPNRDACGSCHDDVNFDTGENHPDGGGIQLTNKFCSNCHPPVGDLSLTLFPVPAVHEGVARAEEGGFYRGVGNGYSIDGLSWDIDAETLTVDFSVTRDGQKMILDTDPRWSNGARLAVIVGWSTHEYTNEGAGSTPAPAQPVSVNGLDVGGLISDEGGGNYQTVFDLSSYGFETVTVAMEGHPQADLAGDLTYESIPVRSAFANISIEKRGVTQARRSVIDIDKCNACHDTAGAGLSLHGNNRADEMQVCVICHNPDVTDIRQRPADPAMSLDGKREQTVDMKRMIHGIHTGADLQDGLVIYGFGGFPHDYSEVEFIGNSMNCLTCHEEGTYSTEAAWQALATTVDTGLDVTTPVDDLNISQVTSTCSSCHDADRATNHMLLNGGSFIALDDDIAIAAPEPATLPLAAAALGTLAALAYRRRRQ
jgi:OmcA/MtrC family decaheme c-type cytochrome